MSGASPLADCRILVVEDEYFMADDLSRALVTAGATILGPIGEIEEALRFVRSNETRIHGAVLDINLRGTATYEVAGELRRRAVPFVFATGYDQAAILPEYRDVPRWEKPFDPAALARFFPGLLHGQGASASPA